ncbi:DUF899 family protein [Amycolatopsis sp. NPDC059021]|uniref:DUF899 family protein n=1 Tax=Amycolatopsis sp. NPDC059021 TaxID=3346704 RepID=UPI00366DC0DB
MTVPELVRPGTARPVPMTAYLFEGDNGLVTLREMFLDRQWLLVHHTIPDRITRTASSEEVEGMLSGPLRADCRLAMVSRARYRKLAQYRRNLGWDLPCYSVIGHDFGADFPATSGVSAGTWDDEIPGVSIFRRAGDGIVHIGSIGVPGLVFLMRALDVLDPAPAGPCG